MDPNTALIFGAIKAAGEAVSAIFKWLCTEEGIAASRQMRTDRAAWDRFWAGAGAWWDSLVAKRGDSL
jgi:hypothetical protein